MPKFSTTFKRLKSVALYQALKLGVALVAVLGAKFHCCGKHSGQDSPRNDLRQRGGCPGRIFVLLGGGEFELRRTQVWVSVFGATTLGMHALIIETLRSVVCGKKKTQAAKRLGRHNCVVGIKNR